jgi:hypothetical protein
MSQGVTAHLERLRDFGGRARKDAAVAELERESTVLRHELAMGTGRILLSRGSSTSVHG